MLVVTHWAIRYKGLGKLMKTTIVHVLFLAALSLTEILLNPAQAAAPSFDCTAAKTWAEITICGDETLAGLDVQVATLYREAKSRLSGQALETLSDEQKAWRKQREDCKDRSNNRSCLTNLYKSRFSHLETTLKSTRGVEGIVQSDTTVSSPSSSLPDTLSRKATISVPLGFSNSISAATFSDDGQYVLAGYGNGNIKLIEVLSGKEIWTVQGHVGGFISHLHFSPNGKLGLSVGHELKLWNILTGKEVNILLRSKNTSIRNAIFSPDSKWIIASGNKSITVWDAISGEIISETDVPIRFVENIDINPDLKYLALGGPAGETTPDFSRNEIIIIELSTGKTLMKLRGELRLKSVAFSPKGSFLLSSEADDLFQGKRTTKLWDLSTGKLARTFSGYLAMRGSSPFSQNGKSAWLLYRDAGKLSLEQLLTQSSLQQVDLQTGLAIKVMVGGGGEHYISFDKKYIVETYGGINAGYGVAFLDTATGKRISEHSGFAIPVISSAFNNDGYYFASLGSDGLIRTWDTIAGKQVSFIKSSFNTMTSIAFSPDGMYIIVGGWGGKGNNGNIKGMAVLYDTVTGNAIKIFSMLDDNERINSIVFSSDGKRVLFGTNNGASLRDVSSWKEIRVIKGREGWVYHADLSPNGKEILTVEPYGEVKLWDVSTGKLIRKQHDECSGSKIEKVGLFSGDGKYFLSSGGYQKLCLQETTPNGPMKPLVMRQQDNSSSIPQAAAFSPDNKRVIVGDFEGTLSILDITAGKEIKVLYGHTGPLRSVAFHPKATSDIALSGSADGTTRLWNVSTGKEIAQFIALPDGEWIVITPEGYYNSSLNGHKYLDVHLGLSVYGIDQFYDVFYRPDIVSAKLRGEDISHLVTLTIDDALKSPPPQVEFTKAPNETDQSKVKICYKAKNTGGGIGEVRLFHNGKLIHSDGFYREASNPETTKIRLADLNSQAVRNEMRSIAVNAKLEPGPILSDVKGDTFEDCREVDAVPGENELSVTAFNSTNTIQSFMRTTSFNAKLVGEEPRLYILSVGIDQYKDPSVGLLYAAKDAKDLETKLLAQSATLYKPQNISHESLTNSAATKTAILGKINELAGKIRPTDAFVLFVAGHGILLQNQYYMLTHDYNGSVSPEAMISSNEIIEMSKKIKSLSQLLIFDTCHAGGVDYIISGLYDARMSVLAKKMGLHIYASANSLQEALDGFQGNGLFTSHLLEGLNNNPKVDNNSDKKVSLVELGLYARKVTTEASKKVGHEQTPLIINFGKDNPVYLLK